MAPSRGCMRSCGPRAHRRDTASDCPTDTPVAALQLSSLAPTRRTSHTAIHRGRHVHCIVQFYSRNLLQQLSHLWSIKCLTHSTDCFGLAASKLFREVGSAVWQAPATEVLFGLHILIKVVFSLNIFLQHRAAQDNSDAISTKLQSVTDFTALPTRVPLSRFSRAEQHWQRTNL